MTDSKPVYGMPPEIKRGDIWRVRFNPVIGSEMDKTRPAVVVSSDAMIGHPVRLVVPITSWDRDYATWTWVVQIKHTKLNGLENVSAADTTQTRSVAANVDRFRLKLGTLESDLLEEIVASIATVIEFQ
jgi:mRNA interferase MazF